jgi:hypothetical protein
LFYVRVALLEDMDGWAFSTGHWIYGTYQLREGETGSRLPKDARVIDEDGNEISPPVPLQPHSEADHQEE